MGVVKGWNLFVLLTGIGMTCASVFLWGHPFVLSLFMGGALIGEGATFLARDYANGEHR